MADQAGARNSSGKESESSKRRRGVDAGQYKSGSADKAGQQVTRNNDAKKRKIDQIMGSAEISPSRQANGVQRGQRDHATSDG